MAFINKTSNLGNDTHIFNSIFTENLTDGANTISIADIMPYIGQWKSGKSYTNGNFVIYNNTLYYCLTDNSDTEFTETNWQKINGGSGIGGCLFGYNDNGDIIPNGDITDSNSIGIATWTKETEYKANDLVLYSDQIYKCLADHTSADFLTDVANWQLESGAQNWAAETFYKANQIVYNNGKMYIALLDHTSGTDFSTDLTAGNWKFMASGVSSPTWQANTIYSVGDLVYANEKVYICKVAHTSTTNFITDLIAGDWQVVANSVSSNMIYDELWDGDTTAGGTYTMTADISNYDAVVVVANNTGTAGSNNTNNVSAIYTKEQMPSSTKIATIAPDFNGVGVYVCCFYFDGTNLIVTISDNGFSVQHVTGIRKETFNTAYTGTTYKTLWDDTTSGGIGSAGTFTLADDVNNYDFLVIAHGDNPKDYIESYLYPKAMYGEKLFLVNGNHDLVDSMYFTLSGNTLTVQFSQNGHTIWNITGIKVNGYTLDYLAELAAPSDIYESITALPYTAPANGWVKVWLRNSGSGYATLAYGNIKYYADGYLPQGILTYFYSIKKGETVSISESARISSIVELTFYYSVGAAKQLGLIS